MRFFITLFIILINIQVLFCKPDSSFADYYPLEIGNYWEYRETINDQIIGSTENSYFSIKVVSDSIMSNGKNYKKLLMRSLSDTNQYNFVFERFDTVSSNIYRYEFSPSNSDENDFLIDSLSLSVNESCEGYYRGWHIKSKGLPSATLTHIESNVDTVFGMVLQFKHFSSNNHMSHPDTYHYLMTKGIGITGAYKSEVGWRYDLNIVYAKIEDKTYGVRNAINTKTNSTSFALQPNYPNPFNLSTTITYSLNRSGKIEVVVFNMLGQKVAILYDGFQNTGIYSINFNPKDLVTGIYICQLKFGDQYQRQKLVLTK
jgi:hypothetical protein